MRKIIAALQVSLDGFIEGPNECESQVPASPKALPGKQRTTP
jgi:hypothetical protein